MTPITRAVTYPRKYLAALRMAGQMRTRPELSASEALAWGNGLHWYGDVLRTTQAAEEILWLLEVLRGEEPHVIVEIGTDQGGTLFLWPYAAAEDALIVAVDARPLGVLGQRSPFAIVRRAFALRDQRIELLIPADSHDPRTVERVQQVLGGRPVDFVFIDADHSYEGVRQDFERFSPLVRPGGIVAFHDIAGDAWPGVVRFFGELEQRYDSAKHVAAGERRYGIGYVRMPAQT